MSAFREALRRSSLAVDSVLGERLLFEPWVSAAYTRAGAADPARPARTLTGTFAAGTGRQATAGDQRFNAQDFRGADIPAGAIIASFRLENFDGPADWPRKDDRFTRLDAEGQPTYIVAIAQSDGESRLYVWMVRP